MKEFNVDITIAAQIPLYGEYNCGNNTFKRAACHWNNKLTKDMFYIDPTISSFIDLNEEYSFVE